MQSIIIKNQNVRFEVGRPEPLTGGGAAEEAQAPDAERCAKSVRLMQSEGLVHAIELRCSCGEVTLIELDYSEPESAETPSEEAS